MSKENLEHLFYTESSSAPSYLEELKKDFLAITDARCKVRIYNIIKMMEE